MTERARYLIVRLGSLGDVVHGIPVAAALRERFPDASIDWVVDPRYVELLRLVNGIDRLIPLDPRAGPGGLLATVRNLRRVRYDAAIDLQGLIKSAVLARLAGARRTIGMTRAHLREPLARLLYTETVEPGNTAHVIFKNLALLSALGIDRPRVAFPLNVPRSAAVDQAVASGEPYALINPGAAWPNKRWPPERFGAVAAALHGRLGLRSLVLWGPDERSQAQAVVDASRGAAILSPPTTIIDIASLARGARLMLSGDTGPLHIAAAVGTPIVALFGPTQPSRNGPWAAADISLSRVDRCSCVYERRCRMNVRCIDGIDVDEVIDAVERRLGAVPARPA